MAFLGIYGARFGTGVGVPLHRMGHVMGGPVGSGCQLVPGMLCVPVQPGLHVKADPMAAAALLYIEFCCVRGVHVTELAHPAGGHVVWLCRERVCQYDCPSWCRWVRIRRQESCVVANGRGSARSALDTGLRTCVLTVVCHHCHRSGRALHASFWPSIMLDRRVR